MEKFAKQSIALSFVLVFSSCASVQMSAYISRVGHPYEQKIYGSFEKVVSAADFVLKNKGWAITNEVDPSIYERDDRYESNGYQNLLIMTGVRKHFLHLTSAHLNVFIHCIENTCDVEIRYESDTRLIKQFSSERNDSLAQVILDALEQEVNR